MRRKRVKRSQPREVFHPGPSVPGHVVQYVRHTWIIDQVLVCCSPTEFYCLKLLFEHCDQPVSFAFLFASLQAFALLTAVQSIERRKVRLAQVISGLRPKLWVHGMEIVNVMGIGYMLVSKMEADPEEWEALHPPVKERANG